MAILSSLVRQQGRTERRRTTHATHLPSFPPLKKPPSGEEGRRWACRAWASCQAGIPGCQLRKSPTGQMCNRLLLKVLPGKAGDSSHAGQNPLLRTPMKEKRRFAGRVCMGSNVRQSKATSPQQWSVNTTLTYSPQKSDRIFRSDF